jgi:hypothetical protein
MRSRSRTLFAMLMAAVSVSAIGMVQFAMADGIERPRRAARVEPVAPPPVAPDVPALLGQAPEPEPCITREAALQVITTVSQDVPPETLQAALANLSGQSSGPMTPEAAALSQRLRGDLARIEECETVQMAVNDAIQVAVVTTDATATIETPGEPDPLPPTQSIIPFGEPEGAEGSGYKHLG